MRVCAGEFVNDKIRKAEVLDKQFEEFKKITFPDYKIISFPTRELIEELFLLIDFLS